MDIEIYLHGTAIERIVSWLESRLGPLRPVACAGDGTRVYHRDTPAPLIPVTITPGAGGKDFTGVWLNSPHTPWSGHVDCARDAHKALGVEVRCDPAGLAPAAAPSTYWRVTARCEELLDWAD